MYQSNRKAFIDTRYIDLQPWTCEGPTHNIVNRRTQWVDMGAEQGMIDAAPKKKRFRNLIVQRSTVS